MTPRTKVVRVKPAIYDRLADLKKANKYLNLNEAVECLLNQTGGKMDIRNHQALDIIGVEHQVQVEIQDRGATLVLYVHVDGITVLRIGRIKPGQIEIKSDLPEPKERA